MKKIIATLLFTLFIAVISASAQTDYCFENIGLKTSTLISFTVKGNKIMEGEFNFGNSDGNSGGELYHFTGTKLGSNLTIKFDHSIPDELKKVKKFVWIFGKTLKVQTYGKNYVTNKWGIYTATYEKCKET